ncbi:universal stress protein [Syntrophobacter fumaroxidans]|uniref:UspA domain protein n=1 Tax=Syntrophobacter fumaroxidans (strain DSM 10017 / MPOB) TaxID=335543 RepID=A0LGG3_SYNFM|nr:universal stress protein [Syntrophobacter fumaroxidans]ABK16515.1 UspA domain protein [Syntrophobacter fumaroxidans MPOB]
MKIEKILWPTDFSKAASVAEPYVVSLSRKYDAEVHLLHVSEDLSRFEHYWGSGLDPKHVKEIHEFGLKLSRERLEELCSRKLTGCARYFIHIMQGDPAQEILTAIRTIGADLVVMATHGMKAIFPFGSVAERVVKNSPVPVFTVNPNISRP